MRTQNHSARVYVVDEFLHHITGMTVSNHNLAIDPIGAHLLRDFTKSLPCCL